MNNVFRAKFATWDMILALSPRELAYEIALGMNAKLGQARLANIDFDVNELAGAIASAYADTPRNRRVIMEGIQLMFSMGLVTESGRMGDPYIYLTRAGLTLATSNDVASHRARTATAHELLDRQILDAVWSAYLKGDHDIAIAYAFKRVEVEMRNKGRYSKGDFGERLVKRFFGDFRMPDEPDAPKASSLTAAEYLFIGAFAIYRNPAAHLDETIEHSDRAMEVLLLANHLLHLVRSAIRRAASLDAPTA
jgi:hypothetical protein